MKYSYNGVEVIPKTSTSKSDNAHSSVAVILVIHRQTDFEIDSILDQINALSWPNSKVYLLVNEPDRKLLVSQPSTVVISAGQNLGFCGGVNMAAAQAAADGCDYLLLLNLDIKILSADLIERLMLVFAQRNDCGFVCPGIVMWPDTSEVWFRGGRILRPLWQTRAKHIGSRWRDTSRGIVATDFFNGCCALIRLSTFLQLGGFDERLFMYYDEADLSSRGDAEGFKCYLLDEPLIAHIKEGKKFNANEAYFHARNPRILVRLNERGIRRLLGQFGQYVVAPRQIARCNSKSARKAYFKGLRTDVDWATKKWESQDRQVLD